MTDIIDQIDAATGCQQCGKPLGRSPSADFCGESCQRTWTARRSVPVSTTFVRLAEEGRVFHFDELVRARCEPVGEEGSYVVERGHRIPDPVVHLGSPAVTIGDEVL